MLNFFRTPKNDELKDNQTNFNDSLDASNVHAFNAQKQNICEKCGAMIDRNDLFCGNCGARRSYESEPLANIHINIGHPVGYFSEDEKIVYLIDNGIEMIKLPQELFFSWANMSNEPQEHGVIDLLAVFRCAIDVNEMANRTTFLNCVPYRQGFGAVDEGKHAIFLGRTPIYVTEPQMMVWRFADGRKTIDEIMVTCGIDEDKVINSIVDLVSYDLMYLKYAR